MGRTVVDEVMLREPRLLVPGMQPLGPVKIDWSNPLTRGLNALFIPTPGARLIDLVNTRFPSVNTGTAVGTANGKAVAYTGGSYAEFTRIDKYNLVSAMTIAVAVSITSLSNYSAFVSCWDTSLTNGWEFRGGAGATDGLLTIIRLGASAGEANMGSASAASAALAAGDAHKLVAVSYPDATVDGPESIYVNGVAVAVQNTYGTGTGVQGTPTTAVLRIGARADGVTYLDGKIHAVWLWARDLTAGEHAAFANDPYQFLIPA